MNILKKNPLNFSFYKSKNWAYFFEKHGDPKNVLRYGEIPKIEKPNLEIIESPINPSDINMIEGKYPMEPFNNFKVAGNEYLGYLHSEGKKRLVLPRRPAIGAWRPWLKVDEKDVFVLPEDIKPHPLLSMVTVNPATAFRLLKDFGEPVLERGDVVVQNCSNSIVGRCVIQIAKIMGYRTVNIIRHGEKFEETKKDLLKIGADLVVSEKEAFENPRGFFGTLPMAKLALNAVGGPATSLLSGNLQNGSSVVTYGAMSKMKTSISASSLIFKDIKYVGFWITKWYSLSNDDERREMIRELYGYMKDGKLTFPVERIPFSDSKKVMENIKNSPKNKKCVISMVNLFEN